MSKLPDALRNLWVALEDEGLGGSVEIVANNVHTYFTIEHILRQGLNLRPDQMLGTNYPRVIVICGSLKLTVKKDEHSLR